MLHIEKVDDYAQTMPAVTFDQITQVNFVAEPEKKLDVTNVNLNEQTTRQGKRDVPSQESTEKLKEVAALEQQNEVLKTRCALLQNKITQLQRANEQREALEN